MQIKHFIDMLSTFGDVSTDAADLNLRFIDSTGKEVLPAEVKFECLPDHDNKNIKPNVTVILE